ncbi:hypothetical protein AB7828_02060 [Tardiphaga sp. 215_C5_N2_1]|uniref:hypothetical protein n=1 Tax=Tardiphaga sp. 215_C5_N2_1 TaxID=3240774 RepID=UPI003F8B7E3A
MVLPTTLTPELMENVRRRWQDTREPINSIAIDVGVSAGTMRRLAARWGWKASKDRAARDLSPAMKLALEAEAATDEPSIADETGDPSKLPSLAERLEAAVEKELAAVEAMRVHLGARPAAPVDSQRTAQTLGSLTETLFKVQRLRAPDIAQAGLVDELPDDADGFRVALAERIERFVRSRADTCVAGAGELSGAEQTGG